MPENRSFANCCEAGGRALRPGWPGAGGGRPSGNLRPPWVAPALSAVLVFTTVVDVVGNLLVILSVLRNRKLRNYAGERQVPDCTVRRPVPPQSRAPRSFSSNLVPKFGLEVTGELLSSPSTCGSDARLLRLLRAHRHQLGGVFLAHFWQGARAVGTHAAGQRRCPWRSNLCRSRCGPSGSLTLLPQALWL